MSRRRPLSKEEKSLWNKVTKDIVPTNRDTKTQACEGIAAPTRILPPPEKSKQQLMGSGTALPNVSRSLKPNLGPPKLGPPVFGAGDPASDRKVARGKQSIDRVLDLHGDSQVEANMRFRHFVQDAFRDQCRCVLVITGKGGAASASAMTQRRSFGDSAVPAPRGGVLRKAFLEWVEQPDLRGMIARASKARPKDGGDGAFYVFLKNNGQHK